ncbi:serine protease inhibitor Kazal-type 9-like [Macrotis lagotis]|uniref:serine protease inhibitor Kazal-type 9-like n=1 Tax=Macrotis lagotis TaxID=92651 RepID=UPI003D69FDED
MKTAIACILFSLVLGAIFSDAANQMGKAGGSSKNQKPSPSNQKMNPGVTDDQEEEKKSAANVVESQVSLSNGNKKPSEDHANCPTRFDPVCGSDGKTYNNMCIFGEANKKSNGKLNMKHRGKC